MKLVKLYNENAKPLVGIEGAENITLQDSILMSDAKFTLLQFNHVKMQVMLSFSESAAANLSMFKNDYAYVIRGFLKPSTFEGKTPADGCASLAVSTKITTVDVTDLKPGDYVLVGIEPAAQKPGPAPVMRKPLAGFQFTPEEQLAALQEYQAALTEWQELVEAYDKEMTTLRAEEYSLPCFGYLLRVKNDNTYEVVADLSFMTTKTDAQFHSYGRYPIDAPTLVGKAVGDFAIGDSIKGMTLVDILTKLLSLTYETDEVGTELPVPEEEKEPVDPDKPTG